MNPLISLAKSAVESFVKEGKIISFGENFPTEFLTQRSGTFVTIEKDGNLRGCIGTYLPIKDNITQEIIANAIAAATEDYRFGPIEKNELPHLSYAVYILSKLELVKNISELNPKKYGIIVKTTPIISESRTNVVFNGKASHKSGLLLPNLEGIETPAQQISIACQKGKIDPEKEKVIIYRFTTEKYAQ